MSIPPLSAVRALRAIFLAVVLLLGFSVGMLFVLGALKMMPLSHGENREEEPGVTFALRTILSRLDLIPSLQRGKAVVAFVVENHEDARPYQRGLEKAILIQEYLVEGFISRFVVLFDVNELPALVGPVRSLRSYFLDGMQPIARVIVHAGGSPDALERAHTEKGVTALNGLAYYGHFERDEEIPAPHNLFIDRENIRELIPEEMPRTSWPPYRIGTSEEISLSDPQVSEVRVNFMSPLHNVTYSYDPWFKWYLRENGNIMSAARPHNVLVIEAPIESVLEFGRLHISLEGGGRLLLFHSGRVFEGRWTKHGVEPPFEFFAEDGAPLTFVAGQTWMTFLPTLDRVSWDT